MSNLVNVAEHYQQQFFAARDAYPMPWLATHRETAFNKFLQQGFPTRQHEEWKYTNVQAIEKIPFCALPKKESSIAIESNDKVYRVAFINGQFSAKHSSADFPENVTVCDFKNLQAEQIEIVSAALSAKTDPLQQGFHALNTAFLQDGIYIDVPDNCVLQKPIEIFTYTDEQHHSNHLQHVIFVGKNSQACVVENYSGLEQSTYFTNVILHFYLDDNASVDLCKLQNEGKNAFHVGTVFSHQGRNSTLRSHSYAFGGALVRSDVYAELLAEGAHCDLNGLYCIDGQQHTDHHTGIYHRAPHCTSSQLYKGVVDEQAHAVFNGKIVVAPHAQKTQAQQRNQTMLLASSAQIDTKPQLEIYADDVKCAHGATVGQLDETSLFYLRSRGIDKAQASQLLLLAFAHDVLSRVSDSAIREKIQMMFETKLKN